jgi:hypothetical protein
MLIRLYEIPIKTGLSSTRPHILTSPNPQRILWVQNVPRFFLKNWQGEGGAIRRAPRKRRVAKAGIP